MTQRLTNIHGRLGGFGPDTGGTSGRPLIVPGGFMSGDHGNQMAMPSPGRVVMFDDFLGDVLADQWNAVETDADGAQAVLAGGIGGQLRITTGNDDGNDVVLPDLSGVTSYLNWQASNGGLEMQARINLSRITDAYAFIGFTDLITIEAPIICNSAETITTNASDAVGFVFDTNFTSATWHLCGVAGNTDATAQILTEAPVAATWVVLRIEVSADGVAKFFIDGVPVGSAMTGAVTAATDLTPALYASNTDGTSALTMDVDYCYVAMNR